MSEDEVEKCYECGDLVFDTRGTCPTCVIMRISSENIELVRKVRNLKKSCDVYAKAIKEMDYTDIEC